MAATLDPLEKLRSKAREMLSPRGGKKPYFAFETSTDQLRHLEIRLKEPEPARSPSNSQIVDIGCEWRFGTTIMISYSRDMVITIDGENLTELYRALKRWKVEYIQEFDPEAHLPPEKSAPFIEAITIHTHRMDA